jgi:adenine-specific DNA-methyltransferase
MNLFAHLKEILSQEEKFCKDGNLFKNNVVEAALKLDPVLLKLLLTDKNIKDAFFSDIDSIIVFDKVKFQKFVSNKQILPDSFTAFRNKIGLTANGEFLTDANEVVLDFPYKDCVLEGGQTKEDQKRKEIFWNETLASDDIDRLFEPKAFTNWKKYDKDGVHKVKDISLDDNLIIKGNNLIALHSLKVVYRDKVKLIYIDPPYNTGNDSFQYNDSFNHSTWLTFMKNRLEVAKDLLSFDGVLVIQSDDNEQAYLKVLLDGIEGLNFISVVAVKAKSSAGASGGGEDKKLKKNFEYLTIFAKSGFNGFKKIYKNEYLEDIIRTKNRAGLSYEYNKVLINKGSKSEVSYIITGKGEKIPVFLHKDYSIVSVKHLMKTESLSDIEVYTKYFDKVFRTQDAQSSIRHKVVDATNKSGDLYSISYIPISGTNKGKLTELFYYKNELVNHLTNVAVIEKKALIKKTILGTLWDDIGWDGIANEGGVQLKFGKKPERLLHRIIEMCTNVGDIVLDYHLGSGTTAAVAHKMNRKYIGLEQMNYGKNDSLVRLTNVINKDETGISKQVAWVGGNSFISCDIAVSNLLVINNINSSSSTKELMVLWSTLKKTDYLSFRISPIVMSNIDNLFKSSDLSILKEMLISLFDFNQHYICFSDIEDSAFSDLKLNVSLNEKFYSL